MKSKFLVVFILVVLAVFFLSTVGNSIVGYSILNPSQATFKEYPYPFIKGLSYNSLSIVIAENPTLIEIEAANKIAKSLKETKTLMPEIVKPSQLSENKNNLILIGDACTNELISYALNTNKCTLNLKKGQGLLKLISGKSAKLIVSGYDLESLNKAASVLANYDLFPLSGTEIVVEGNSNNLLSLSLIQR